MLTNARKLASGALIALALGATCSQATEAAKNTAASTMSIPAVITGTLSYRERIALTPGSEAFVQLLDAATADVPTKVVAEQRIAITGQIPIEFRLDYDAVQIDPKHTYTVSARITNEGKLLFQTDTANYVITRGSPGHVELVLKKATNPKQ